MGRGLRVGIAHHFGWAIAVTADSKYEVVDRRRIELVEDGLTPAPIHYDRATSDDATLAALVAEVRASVARATAAALDALPTGVTSISLRAWPADFPDDIATLRSNAYEAKADSVMYVQILDDVARARGWSVHQFNAATVEAEATRMLGDRARDVLHGPRQRLGAPWAKDHRVALAATVLAN